MSIADTGDAVARQRAAIAKEIDKVQDALDARIPTPGFQVRMRDLWMTIPKPLQTDPKCAEIVYRFHKALLSPGAPLHKHPVRGNALGQAVKKLRRDPSPDDDRWVKNYFANNFRQDDPAPAQRSLASGAGSGDCTGTDTGSVGRTGGPVATRDPLPPQSITVEPTTLPRRRGSQRLPWRGPQGEIQVRTTLPVGTTGEQSPGSPCCHQPSHALTFLPPVPQISPRDAMGVIAHVQSQYIPCPRCFQHWVEVGGPNYQIVKHPPIIMTGSPRETTVQNVRWTLFHIRPRGGDARIRVLMPRAIFFLLLSSPLVLIVLWLLNLLYP